MFTSDVYTLEVEHSNAIANIRALMYTNDHATSCIDTVSAAFCGLALMAYYGREFGDAATEREITQASEAHTNALAELFAVCEGFTGAVVSAYLNDAQEAANALVSLIRDDAGLRTAVDVVSGRDIVRRIVRKLEAAS